MTRTTIPETVIPGKRLGRHIRQDPRDLNYPAEIASALFSVKHSSAGLPLDQGDVGSCTANALCGALNSLPHWKPGAPTLGEQDALRAYSLEEQAIYGSPYPPEDQGGTGQDVCDAGVKLGWLSGYQHATTVQQAILALVIRPVITGVPWFTSFDQPLPADGYVPGLVEISQGATVRGGHEVCADELVVPPGATIKDLDEILVGMWNSWGTGWGLGGRFYWTAATWKQLLDQGGDVTIPRTKPGWVAPVSPAIEAVAA